MTPPPSVPAPRPPARAAVLAVLLAAAGPGLLFAPVFGILPLLLPLAVVVAVGFGVTELCRLRPALVPWRAVLVLFAGLLALAEALLFRTTVGGLPTGETVRVLVAGVTDSWQLTLQSTWPARPDPELLLFVPLAALAAAVLGVELIARLRWPLPSLLPGLAVLALSQAYVALTGLTAMIAAFGFAVLAAVLLGVADQDRLPAPTPDRTARRTVVALVLVAPTLVLSIAGAVLATATDPVDRPAYSLRDKQYAPLPPERVTSPLAELAEAMQDPDEQVFTYSTSDPVDRWRLAVLDTFDGSTWRQGGQPRRLGTVLEPDPAVTVRPTARHARITFPETDGPWLPSQPMPASVTDVAPYVDETSGMLLLPNRSGSVEYELSWWEPDLSAVDLRTAAIDHTQRSGLGNLGQVPKDITELARKAVDETRPAFQTALVLERYLRDNYRWADGDDLTTGSGWHQLENFLLRDKAGTSEQFAAAYVVLARIIGLPARLAVGYRAPESGSDVVVHNSDALAWPEVAVAGVGWVALDPTPPRSGSGSDSTTTGLADATQEAREQLPPQEDVPDPELPPDDENAGDDGKGPGFTVPVVPVVLSVAALLVLWLVGVPLVRAVRAWRRRRRPGAGSVVGAWAEARDRLRAHGVPFTAGMTVRDLAGAAGRTVDPAVVTGLHQLARTVDVALWSPYGPSQTTSAEAWSAVRAVRRGLARRPLSARLRAALDVRSLLAPRA